MNDQQSYTEVFLDLLPNQPKDNETRELLCKEFSAEFGRRLPEAVERVWELPAMIVKPCGEYLPLLLEARELFLSGCFYSCVAMCGIVGERLVKDVFRSSVLIWKNGKVEPSTDTAFDQFERVEVSAIVRFLKEADLLSAEAAKSAMDLGELRNQYAHARGKKPQEDALRAIKLLHVLVDDTVSVFKTHV
jgi:hypothetical protein